MKKTLILLALAGFAAAGCGDDGDDKVTETKPDASVAKPDSGVVVRPVQITNLGAACTAKGDCQGPGATCETEVGMDDDAIELPGGFCTAQCNDSLECGTGGGCPVADITASLPDAIKALAGGLGGGIVPSNCFQLCTAGGTSCRDGYECSSIKDLVPPALANNMLAAGFLMGPAFNKTYCLPPAPETDGGVSRPDAGAALIVTGLDAGL